MTISFIANSSTVGPNDDAPGVCLKISGAAYEMNVWLAVADLHLLERVPSTPWEGGALKLGTSAGADVWWSCDDGEVLIAAGRDDQTWDFGVNIPLARFADLRAAIDHEVANGPT